MSSGTVTMAEPVCLIKKDEDGNLLILQQAVAILKKIEQPVVVVAVVGPYRTGKSYLMNRLAGKRKGFALGASVQPKTKGIWMWCIPHPEKKGHTLVLLDTEGLGSTEKEDTNDDNWIFSLAVLLSSALVYNSRGTIDSVAIQQLHYVTELTKHIKVKSQASDERFFPSFVWTVRDLSLELECDGKPITADQYLENALKLKPGCDDNNLPQKCLLNYFPTRKCFVFGRPASDKKLKHMEDLSDEDLKPSFVQDAKRFCDYILSEVKAKTIEGRNVSGKMLGSLAEMYLGAISSDKIPCLENAVVCLARIENSNAVAEAVKFYKENMAKRVVFPTETKVELSGIHGEVEEQAVTIFIGLCFMDEDQKCQIDLKYLLQTEYTAICDKNDVESKKACESIIKRIFKPLDDNVAFERYKSVGGHQQYNEDLERFTSQYRSAKGKGIKGEESLNEYLDGKKPVGKAIESADQSLRDAQKKGKILTVVGTTLGVVAGAGAAVVAVPAVVVGLGFTATGIAAGSTAAGMMSAAAIANGGAVAAGSTVAVLQSIGAVGAVSTTTAVVSSAVGGAVGYIGSLFA